VSKKEHEWLKQEIAEQKAKARSKSEERQEEIKVRWDLDEQQLKEAKSPTERRDIEEKLKTQKIKKLLNSIGKFEDDEKIGDRIRQLRVELRELGEDDKVFDRIFDRIRDLVELAGLQDREIEYLTPFRCELDSIHASHAEQQSGKLGVATLIRIGEKLRPFTRKSAPKQTSKQRRKSSYEYKRRGYNRDGVGEIERQFGLGYTLSSALSPFGPYCLDEIFKAAAVNMRRLQELFGMERHRFPKKLRTFERGRETLYDYRAVVKIMKTLLKEDLGEKPVRGKTRRLWPRADLRTRVLSGIAARIKIVPTKKKIATAFVNMIRPHLADSGK
jgi:hypothetical protein